MQEMFTVPSAWHNAYVQYAVTMTVYGPCRLETRLEEHSQISKALRLKHLRERLTTLQIEGANKDTDYAILSLIFNLANRPLESVVPELHATGPWTPSKQHVSRDVQTVPWASPASTKRSRQQDSDDEYDPYASSSDLSDWGEHDDTEQDDEASPCHSPTSKTPRFAPGPHTTSASQALVPHDNHLLSRTETLQNRTGEGIIGMLQSCSATDLVPMLSSVRLAGVLFGQPRQEMCVTDQYIVHQVSCLLNKSHIRHITRMGTRVSGITYGIPFLTLHCMG